MPHRSAIVNDVVIEAAKAAPPVGVSAAGAMSGWDLNHWVALATLVYISLQVAHLLWKWRRQARDGIVEEA
jgi:hypothetical protein